MDAAIACDEDDAIRVVVLTGAGKMFCAGGDIDGFAVAGEDTGTLFKQLTAPVHSAVSKLMRMEKPLVTVINGPAAGARSEEHTSELQSLMRISYAVFCLKKKKTKIRINHTTYIKPKYR